MPKAIFHGQEARDKVLAGAETLFRAVSATMSPLGKNVAIKRPYGHSVTHDGVTVAESIVLPDVTEAIGAEIIKEAAGKLNNEVGDGTTTVTVLTYNLLKGANHLIKEGMNPMRVKRELSVYLDDILERLKKYKVELTEEMLYDVATISAGDNELGNLIGNLAQVIGDGTITVEVGSGLETEVEVIDGFTMSRGWLSPHFITDRRTEEAILSKPLIAITNEKYKAAQDVVPILETALKLNEKKIVLVADEVSGEALSLLVQNHLKGVIQVVVVKSPGFGNGRLPALEDLAALTDGEIYSGGDIVFGVAEKVVVGKENTVILKGQGDVTERINELKAQAKSLKGYEKEQVEKRIANLKGKVGVIRVGGMTEAEIEEKKYRVDDAVSAVKAAQDGGIVAGGGVTLFNIASDMEFEDKPYGVKAVVQNALTAPLHQILTNAEMLSDELLNKIMETNGKGVDVLEGDDVVDMIKAGVIDPYKVTHEALKASFSLAMTGITIDVLVVDVPDDDTI